MNIFIKREHKCNCDHCGFEFFNESPEFHIGVLAHNGPPGSNDWYLVRCMPKEKYEKLPEDTVFTTSSGKEFTKKEFEEKYHISHTLWDGRCYT